MNRRTPNAEKIVKKKLLRTSLILLVITTAGWVFFTMRNQSDISSPTAKRDASQLEELMRGQGNKWAYLETLTAHPTINDLGEGDLGVETIQSFVRESHSSRILIDPYSVGEMIEAANGVDVEVPGGGRISITGGAFAYANAGGRPASKIIDWRNLDQTKMEKPPVVNDWEWMFENPRLVGRPQGLMGVRAEGFKEPPRWLSMHVFDARTNYHLGDARKKRPHGNVGFFGGEFKIWRRMPIIVVIDFAAGGWDRKIIPFEAGQKVSFFGEDAEDPKQAFRRLRGSLAGSEVQLQAAIEGHSKRVNFPHNRSWDGQLDLVDMQPGGFRGIFSVIPAWNAQLIAVRNPDEEKNRIDWLEPNRWMIAGFNTGDVPKRLEIIHARKVYRAVFRLDEFPGLPASVGDVENLFETPIPAYRTINRQQALWLVGSMVQMEVHGPGNHYPLEGTDATAQQLLNRVRNDVPIVVDSEKNEIRVVGRKAWVQWIRDRWPF
ncbi:MAG: hypothetical protein AAF585_19225 [Verrucomicrobiota bacterium]